MTRISESYRELNCRSHRENPEWGRGGLLWKPHIAQLLGQEGVRSVLDYGCGKGGMVHALKAEGFDARGYDPGVEAFSGEPAPADFLISLDVLEHVEPECIGGVLEHIASLAPKAFLVISCRKAKHRLPDGRNAHLIIESHASWLDRLGHVFQTIRMDRGMREDELAVLCGR